MRRWFDHRFGEIFKLHMGLLVTHHPKKCGCEEIFSGLPLKSQRILEDL